MRSRSIASAAPRRRAVACPAALASALLLALAAPAVPAATATSTAIGVKTTETRNLPRTVEAALARGGIPRDAMVAWVQEVDAARPRLAWQADRPR
jgi:hypothetical protein